VFAVNFIGKKSMSNAVTGQNIWTVLTYHAMKDQVGKQRRSHQELGKCQDLGKCIAWWCRGLKATPPPCHPRHKI